MVNIRLFLYFFKKENLFNLLLFFSLPTVFFVADIFFLFFMTRLIGIYLAFALFFLFTAAGQIILFRSFAALLDDMKDGISRNDDCQGFYYAYAGTMPAMVFLLYPGVLSTIIGWILLIPPLRRRSGERVTRYFQIDWDEINEYLFLLL